MLCDEVYKEKSNVVAMERADSQNTQPAETEDSAELERRTIAMINKINKVL